MIELLSIDLSNYCSKQCSFCYNHSRKEGNTMWQPQEVISFALDCIAHGIKAVSLGGGEPFEYDGVFRIIDELFPKAYLSVTSNGIPLENDSVWNNLCNHKPDKIHITIHNPDDGWEVERVVNRIKKLDTIGIKPGVNMLVGADKINYCRDVYEFVASFLSPEQIILVPQRFNNTPTPKQLALITRNKPFQSPSCLLKCNPPTNFVSVSWDKKVNSCSFAKGKETLETLDYEGLTNALKRVNFESCMKRV